MYRVDSEAKTVILTNGDHISYDKLCIATGCDPWKPPVKGLDLKNVFPLRSNKDQEKIKAACKDAKNIVLIGASFVGSECAASIKAHRKDEVNITMVNGEKTPFFFTLGETIGAYM